MRVQLRDDTPTTVREEYARVLQEIKALEEEHARKKDAISKRLDKLITPYLVYGLRDVARGRFIAKGTFDECFAKGVELVQAQYGEKNVRHNDAQIWHAPAFLGDPVDYRVQMLMEDDGE